MSKASDRAYAVIRGMILTGELAGGEQLSEEALALRCGVSRTPVRDALRRLEAELLVRRSESQRTFVADWSPGEVEEAFALRGLLEGYATRRAAERMQLPDLARLQAHNRALLTAVSPRVPDIDAFLEHNRQFHAIIVEVAASSRLATVLAGLVEQPVVSRTAHNYDRDNLMRSHAEHEELLSAFERGDGRWAEAIMTAHIRRAFHAYVDARGTARSRKRPSAA